MSSIEAQGQSAAAPSPRPQVAARFDVAVVGGGPSGLASAILAARAGFSTALVAPLGQWDDARTTALLAGSMTMLERMGLAEAVAAKGQMLRVMRLVDDTGRLIRAPEVAFESSEIGLPTFGYNIANIDLNTILLDAARATAGLTLIDAKLDQASTGEAATTLTLDDGRVLTARLIVGADGRKSKCRDAAGIDVRQWTYPQSAMVMNLDCAAPHDDISTEFHGRNGPFVLVPLPGNRISIVLVEAPATIERLNGLDDAALARELETRAHSLLGRFTIEGRRQVYPLSAMTARTFGRNRVALVGEAAHVFPPIGAQGLNLGLRDVATLGDLLDKAGKAGEDPGGAALLAAYDRARAIDINSRTATVDTVNRALLSEHLPAQVARGFGLWAAKSIPPLRRLMMREGMVPTFATPRLMRGTVPR